MIKTRQKCEREAELRQVEDAQQTKDHAKDKTDRVEQLKRAHEAVVVAVGPELTNELMYVLCSLYA